MTSSVLVQQSTSSAVSVPFSLKKWMGPLQIEPLMSLYECMNSIAKISGIQNPMDGQMRRTFCRISINMTNELLDDMLNDYADSFNTILIVIPFDDNMLIDYNRTSVFTGNSHIVDGQLKQQQRVFIMYDCRQQSFAPLSLTHTDGNLKIFFDCKDDESICKEISEFIFEWNCQKCQSSISEIGNIIVNNNVIINDSKVYNTDTVDAQLCSTLATDTDIFMSSSEVIKNRLQLISQLITQMSPQFDLIQLKNKSAHALLNDFNHLSNENKIEMVCDVLTSISEVLRIATVPTYEEEVEETSSMEIEHQRHCPALSNTENIQNKETIFGQQYTSHQFNPSSTLKCLATTADAQQPSILLSQYPAPKILKEPTRHQRVRMFSELASGVCPLIQAGGADASQQTYVEIEVPNENGIELHAGVRAVTVKKVKHPYKSVVPQKPPIDILSIDRDGERRCLKCDKNDFDPDLECTYLPISREERVKGRKEIPVNLINWKRQGVGLKKRTENENLHICKLEFYLCIRNGPGKYQRVSAVSYSSIIEEGDGPVTINLDAVKLKQICERGGQIIHLPLSVECLKRGFRVLCNGKNLSDTKFRICQKQLLIITPSQTSNNINLHLEILRNEYDDDREANIEKPLYADDFTYISHDNQSSHICSEQRFTEANINTQ